ncbi:hypothetical protein KY308_03975, partial [Candidatus Woesearchaeota archaeon]|nr:hypothetical protein [Candidatus Woesearchaeota archaeon]
MKNLILIAVCFVLVLFLAGCAEEGVKVVTVSPQGEPAAEQPATTQTQTSTSEPAPQTQTSQQQASTTSVSTKADLEITSYFLSSLNAEQNEEFEVKFKIKNAGTEAITNFEYSIKIMEGNDVIKSNFYNYTP